MGVLEGVGAKRLKVFAEEGVLTIQDLLDYSGENQLLYKFKEKATRLAEESTD